MLRVRELGSTGIPYPFVIEYELLILEPREVEQQVHQQQLAKYRREKEFFAVDLQTIVQAVARSVTALGRKILIETVHDANLKNQNRPTFDPSFSDYEWGKWPWSPAEVEPSRSTDRFISDTMAHDCRICRTVTLQPSSHIARCGMCGKPEILY